MPLPPRDMTSVHVAANPALCDMHRAYPLSRYAPVMAALKLFQLARGGIPLAARLDVPSWLIMACLDDAGADFCIAHLVQTLAHCPTAPLYATLAYAAAPFLVPMMVPMTYYGPAAATPPEVVTTHVSATAATSTAESTATDLVADATSRHRSKAAARGVPASSSLAGLPSSVLRAICYMAMERGVDMSVFEHISHQLKGMTESAANAVLREFDRALAVGQAAAGEAARNVASQHRAALSQTLLKHMT